MFSAKIIFLGYIFAAVASGLNEFEAECKDQKNQRCEVLGKKCCGPRSANASKWTCKSNGKLYDTAFLGVTSDEWKEFVPLVKISKYREQNANKYDFFGTRIWMPILKGHLDFRAGKPTIGYLNKIQKKLDDRLKVAVSDNAAANAKCGIIDSTDPIHENSVLKLVSHGRLGVEYTAQPFNSKCLSFEFQTENILLKSGKPEQLPGLVVSSSVLDSDRSILAIGHKLHNVVFPINLHPHTMEQLDLGVTGWFEHQTGAQFDNVACHRSFKGVPHGLVCEFTLRNNIQVKEAFSPNSKLDIPSLAAIISGYNFPFLSTASILFEGDGGYEATLLTPDLEWSPVFAGAVDVHFTKHNEKTGNDEKKFDPTALTALLIGPSIMWAQIRPNKIKPGVDSYMIGFSMAGFTTSRISANATDKPFPNDPVKLGRLFRTKMRTVTHDIIGDLKAAFSSAHMTVNSIRGCFPAVSSETTIWELAHGKVQDCAVSAEGAQCSIKAVIDGSEIQFKDTIVISPRAIPQERETMDVEFEIFYGVSHAERKKYKSITGIARYKRDLGIVAVGKVTGDIVMKRPKKETDGLVSGKEAAKARLQRRIDRLKAEIQDTIESEIVEEHKGKSIVLKVVSEFKVSYKAFQHVFEMSAGRPGVVKADFTWAGRVKLEWSTTSLALYLGAIGALCAIIVAVCGLWIYCSRADKSLEKAMLVEPAKSERGLPRPSLEIIYSTAEDLEAAMKYQRNIAATVPSGSMLSGVQTNEPVDVTGEVRRD